MIRLTKTRDAWGQSDFSIVCKTEIEGLDPTTLPLQAGLANSSVVGEAPIGAIIQNATDNQTHVQIIAGIVYGGIIAGSCCADDPTPVCEETEFCVLRFIIDKESGETAVELIPDTD